MADPDEAGTGIRIRGLYKIYGRSPGKFVDRVRGGMGKEELRTAHRHALALKDINIEMPGGRIQVIMGLSGSGKSNLIRHINRLIDPTVGEILVDGVDICRMKRKQLQEFRRNQTAMVFQKFALMPHRTVLDNTVYGLEIQGISREMQEESARRWLDRVGLSDFENHFPCQLSDDLQQRAGLARALTNDAPILLMDEAFAPLDPLIRAEMQAVLLDLQKEIRKTIVFVTQDLDEALRLGDRIAILRDGELVQQGTGQEIILEPADEHVAKLVQSADRGQVLTVENVMKPWKRGIKKEGVAVPEGTSLEGAAEAMALDGGTKGHVVNDEGKTVGTLDIHDVVSSIVAPRQGTASV